MTVLVAVDERERSKEILEIAYDLAGAYDDTLVVLHVIPREGFEAHKRTLRDTPEFEDFTIDMEAETARRIAREFAHAVIDDPDLENVEARGRVGDIVDQILKQVESTEPRYLVIGGRRRSPVGKAVFGNTAQEVLLHADCPVVSKLSDS